MKKTLLSLAFLIAFTLPSIAFADMGTYMQVNGMYSAKVTGTNFTESTDYKTKNLFDNPAYGFDLVVGYNAKSLAIEAGIGRMRADATSYTYSANDMRVALSFMPRMTLGGLLPSNGVGLYPYHGVFVGSSTIDTEFKSYSGKAILYGFKTGLKIYSFPLDNSFIDIGAIKSIRNYNFNEASGRKESTFAWSFGIGITF